MNKFQLMGRLTRNPEYKEIGEVHVANFTLAVNRRYVAPGQERQVDFFNLVAYSKNAEFVKKYYKKGQQVLIEGRMQNRTYEDKNGEKRYITDYITEQCYFADSNKNNEYIKEDDSFITIDDDVELPF